MSLIDIISNSPSRNASLAGIFLEVRQVSEGQPRSLVSTPFRKQCEILSMDIRQASAPINVEMEDILA